MATWKERNWERYVAKKKEAEARPEYLAKRRACYVPTGNPRGRPRLLEGEEAMERRRALSRVRSKTYRDKIATRKKSDETNQAECQN